MFDLDPVTERDVLERAEKTVAMRGDGGITGSFRACGTRDQAGAAIQVSVAGVRIDRHSELETRNAQDRQRDAVRRRVALSAYARTRPSDHLLWSGADVRTREKSSSP